MAVRSDEIDLNAVRRPGLLSRAWGAIAVVMAVLYTAVLSIAAALTAPFHDGHAVSHIGRLWAWLIIRTCGVMVEIEGLEHLEGLESFVMVSNHQSMFDIFAILAYIPGETRFLAKKELRRVPLVGYAMGRSGHVFVDRERRGGNAIRRAIEVSRLGYNLCVFAEGTRFSDNQVHEFNDGAAWIAIATRRPCIPIAISGSAAIFPRGAKVVVPGLRIRIRIGAPIETRDLKSSDRFALTRQLEAAVRATFISELRNSPTRGSAPL
ncbi:MAG TPA: lysophospholipid acyltransferase family protein [Candidatus Binataceae bacterium]|nr:lysophospholipid acyltransferase family protein [Candidatus Binataceae bacterium]